MSLFLRFHCTTVEHAAEICNTELDAEIKGSYVSALYTPLPVNLDYIAAAAAAAKACMGPAFNIIAAV